MVKAVSTEQQKMNLSVSFYLLLLTFCLFRPAVLLAEEANSIRVKTLYVFIGADLDQVIFENIWVFERDDSNVPWQVGITLPSGSTLIGMDEPNQMHLEQGGRRISKNMTADSLVDSLGFSFSLLNRRGNCETQIKCDYRVESMVVHLSGPACRLSSDILKPNDFMAARSRFSSVYTANDLPAGTKLVVDLTRLPRKDSNIWEIATVLFLGLIVIIALLTMYYHQKKLKDKSDNNEACSEQSNLP